MKKQLVKDFGEFWQRSEMFEVSESGRVQWTDRGWHGKNPPLSGARGIYILYRGTKPIYVGKAIDGEHPLASRIRKHALDWYSHAWDNVSWFRFDESVPKHFIEAVEAILIANIPGTLNGVIPAKHLGRRSFLGSDKNHARNTMWGKPARKADHAN